MPARREWKHKARILMRPELRDVGGVALFGRYNYVHARPALTEHMHARDIEICYLVKGRQNYCVGGSDYQLRGGDVFITFPGEKHSSGGSPEEKGVLYWVALEARARASRRFLDLPHPQARAVLNALLKVPRRHFPGSKKMQSLLDATTDHFHDRAAPLAAVKIANSLQAFVLEVIDCAAQSPAGKTGRSVTSIMSAVRSEPGAKWSVPRMAQSVGLSTARFKARFKEETGLPPGEFVLRTRVQEAQRRLRLKQDSITDIALDLGFSSSQYFATVYRRFTGTTPRAMRR